MSYETTLCVVVRCSMCSTWACDLRAPRHWPSLTAAVEELAGPAWCWFATSQVQICSDCASRLRLQRPVRRCVEGRHQWQAWTELTLPELEELVCERVCTHCGIDQVVAAECLA
jgi:hypothetical protein